ncbi:MAG: dephospho-CoA kinase, partial [Chloroflexi bacterium]|nr:dephospho-CoA kinase [Chloroflexota bacterium]
MRVIGLTGGIGTGKSEAARILAELGAVVIDADAEGHRAYARGSIGWRRLVELFSSGILNDDQEIDRARLGQLVFANPQALAWLNAAIHPLIRQQVSQAIERHRENGEHAVVIDAALLYQAKWDDLADEVWAVSAPPDVVLERMRQRGMTPEDVRRRSDAQGGGDAALGRADAIIENSSSPEDLRARVQGLWEERIL